jgi:SAM-dependent methyltransferase
MTETPRASLDFDRAAEYYDETRAIDEAALADTIDLLAAELGGRGRVLEMGVGTGILALPLAAVGVPLAGLDLSLPMMRKLVEKAGGRAPVSLVRADATRMPFRDGTFGGAYARWVLHLIPAWRDAVGELCRVVGGGGTVLIEAGGYTGRWHEMWLRFQEITRGDMATVGLDVRGGFDELDAAFASQGATFRALPLRVVVDPVTVEEFFDRLERRLYSWTWRISEDDLRRAIAEVRPWAAERWGRLDVPLDPEHPMMWRAYDLA